MEENEKNLSQNNGLSNQVTSFPVLVGGPYIFSVFYGKNMYQICKCLHNLRLAICYA